jgi:hypothetical protein
MSKAVSHVSRLRCAVLPLVAENCYNGEQGQWCGPPHGLLHNAPRCIVCIFETIENVAVRQPVEMSENVSLLVCKATKQESEGVAAPALRDVSQLLHPESFWDN